MSATLNHFRQGDQSAVIVLPTGAGKSLVIAQLAKLARQKILVLAHVKELVEQNHEKYQAYGLTAGIFSAGLKQKITDHQVTFASIQSVSRNLDLFAEHYSLVIIDECHRISDNDDSQYNLVINQLKKHNSGLKVLGLTATPYRMGMGWIYQYHYHGFRRATEPRPFAHCIYELPLSYMIKNGYLTPPNLEDATLAHYDFSTLKANQAGHYPETEVNALLARHPRVTETIVEQIRQLAQERHGVMIFAASIDHAKEIQGYLSDQATALVTGDTPGVERDALIVAFKQRQLKYLINVAVLTTGFDAPHVDMIAILRPTQSVSLYQQIVGRGLRLADGKTDCLVIDYAGNGFDLFYPEVGEQKPTSDSVPVMINCPSCGFGNTFWGKTDDAGNIIEHFGRRCWGFEEDDHQQKILCDYRFRFKECPHCGAENDIAARNCHQCHQAVIDPDDKLKDALKLKNALVIRCAGLTMSEHQQRLKITYHDEDGVELSESFDLTHKGQRHFFNLHFGRRFNHGLTPKNFTSLGEVLAVSEQFTPPDFVIARKAGHHWRIKEKIFDYQGAYRKANELN